MTTLTIGMLTQCPDCNRYRREPGAEHCPDCTIMRRMHRSLAYDIETLVEEYTPDAPDRYLSGDLAQNDDFKLFATVGEFVDVARRWRKRNPYSFAVSRRRCPHCGGELDDDD